MIVRRKIEQISVTRNSPNSVRAVVNRGTAVVAQRFGVVNITRINTDKYYEHSQAVPSTTWTINHNLGKFPAISIVDTSNREWLGSITHNSINQAVVSFAASFGGKAYCN